MAGVSDSGGVGYTRIALSVAKWECGRTPEDGEPDDIYESVDYLTPKLQRPVTSAKMIERLERRYQRRLREGEYDAISDVDG